MRVISLDARKGVFEVQVESPEDLYYLAFLIRQGDVVYAWTFRQVKISRALGSERGNRVRVYLGVEVEGKEFHRFSKKLRLKGKIVEAPERIHAKGSYHTLSVGVGDAVKVVKKDCLGAFELSLLEESTIRIRRVLIISLGLEEVVVGLLGPQGFDLKVKKTYTLPERGEGFSLKKFAQAIMDDVLALSKRIVKTETVSGALILAPSLLDEWCRESFVDRLSEVVRVIGVVRVSEGGLAGVYEALRGGKLRDIISDVRALREAEGMRTVLSELSGKGRVAIGKEEVRSSVEWGVVKEVMVLDTALLEDEEILAIIQKVATSKIPFTIVSEESEAGAMLRRLGSIVAILYYKPSGD